MHVLCAVLMYVFWWNKPMDVRYPIDLGEKINGVSNATMRIAATNHHDSSAQSSSLAASEPGEIPRNQHEPTELDATVGSPACFQLLANVPIHPSEIGAVEVNHPSSMTMNPSEKTPEYMLDVAPSMSPKIASRSRWSVFWQKFSLQEDWPDMYDHNAFRSRWIAFWRAYNSEWRAFRKFKYLISVYGNWHETFNLWPTAQDTESTEMKRARALAREIRGSYITDRARMIKPDGYVRKSMFSWETFFILSGLSLLWGSAHSRLEHALPHSIGEHPVEILSNHCDNVRSSGGFVYKSHIFCVGSIRILLAFRLAEK